MKYWSDKWKAKILDPKIAQRWANKLKRAEGQDVADDFRRAFADRAIFGDEHSEYRYWATGVHEPATASSEVDGK